MPTQFSSSASTVRGLTRAALCTACACLLAPVSIPIGPVSLTLGVFAILLAGALLPPALAALSACAYLLLGFAGLPVFAGFAAGPGVLFGMTGGYLLAYPIMAWLLSMVCEKTRSRGVRMAGVALAGAGVGHGPVLPAGHRLVHGCHRHGTVGVPLSLCDSLYPARPCKGLVCPLAGRAPALTPAA